MSESNGLAVSQFPANAEEGAAKKGKKGKKSIVELCQTVVEEQEPATPKGPLDLGRFALRDDISERSDEDDENLVVGRTLVGRPKKNQWVYASPDPAYSLTVGILEPTEDKEDIYIVSGNLVNYFSTEANFKLKRLVLTMTS